MISREDTVLRDCANNANRKYIDTHTKGDAYLLEIKRGENVSFASWEMYDPDYGNGIAINNEHKRLTEGKDGSSTYKLLNLTNFLRITYKFNYIFSHIGYFECT